DLRGSIRRARIPVRISQSCRRYELSAWGDRLPHSDGYDQNELAFVCVRAIAGLFLRREKHPNVVWHRKDQQRSVRCFVCPSAEMPSETSASISLHLPGNSQKAFQQRARVLRTH